MGEVLSWSQAGAGPLVRARRWRASIQLCAARSGRAAFVSMVEAADLRDRHDVAITGRHDRTGNRRVLVVFLLAKRMLERYFPDKLWLFPQILVISKRWLRECLVCKDDAFPQLLLLADLAHDAVDRIYRSIVASTPGAERLIPVLRPNEAVGTTRHVDFDTIKNIYLADPESCHVSHVVADTGSWEQKVAFTLEHMGEVVSYVKNQGLGQKDFTIPYTMNGEDKSYYPDFIVRVDMTRPGQDRLPQAPKPQAAPGGIVNVIVEVSGEERKDKANKVATAKTLWVPAVNNVGWFGHWVFEEVEDPGNAKSVIRQALRAETEVASQ